MRGDERRVQPRDEIARQERRVAGDGDEERSTRLQPGVQAGERPGETADVVGTTR